MISYHCNGLSLEIPKTDRCLSDPGDQYTLIIQNNYTKRIFIYTVRDEACNPVRFRFTVPLEQQMGCGEYTYYLCSQDKWQQCNLDHNLVERSWLSDHDVIAVGGMAVIGGGNLLVQKGIETDHCEPYPQLFRTVQVITSGIIKLKWDENKTEEYETGEDYYRQP